MAPPPIRVAVIRTPGILTYEKIIEEFRDRVRGVVRVLAAKPDQEAAISAWLTSFQPSLVFAVGQDAYDLVSAQEGIPVIHALVYHRVRPGHVALPSEVPLGAVLSALKQVSPKAEEVGILLGPRQDDLAAAHAGAAVVGFRLRPLRATTPEEAITRLREASTAVDAIILRPDLDLLRPLVFQYTLMIQSRRRIPVVGATRRHTAQGALMALDYAPQDIGRAAAEVANQILQGATIGAVADPLPDVTLNISTAQRIGANMASLWDLAVRIYH